jgi:hypothetical protein
MDASCQCHAISFKTPLPKPLALYICHCLECRHQSSSAFGCSAMFPKFPLPNEEMLSSYSCVLSLVILLQTIYIIKFLCPRRFGLVADMTANRNRRPTDSGNLLNCYFCKKCGSRIMHVSEGKDIVSIKGGCIEGLDWANAVHIWCKRAGESSLVFNTIHRMKIRFSRKWRC